MDAGNFRWSCCVTKNKMHKMCIFAKDCDVKNPNFVKAIRRSDDILSVDYKGDGVNLILLSINDGDQQC